MKRHPFSKDVEEYLTLIQKKVKNAIRKQLSSEYCNDETIEGSAIFLHLRINEQESQVSTRFALINMLLS